MPAPGWLPDAGGGVRVNPNSSLRHRHADVPPCRSGVPWWEAVPWHGRVAIEHVRPGGPLEGVCLAVAVECVVLLALAIAGLVATLRGGVL